MQKSDQEIIRAYRRMVETVYPGKTELWPVISGYNLRHGKYLRWTILVFEHTGNPVALKIPLEHISTKTIGVDDISKKHELVRRRLAMHLRLRPEDALLLLNSRHSNLEQELKTVFKQHEAIVVREAERKDLNDRDMTISFEKEMLRKETAAGETFTGAASEVAAAPVTGSAQEKNPAPWLTGPGPSPEEVGEPDGSPTVQPQPAAAAEPGSFAAGLLQPQSTVPGPDKTRVLVICGQNFELYRAMTEFLRAIDLQPVGLDELKESAGHTDMAVDEIYREAFARCQVVISLLAEESPVPAVQKAEGANLALPPAHPASGLFETGVAAGINRPRTIIVEYGSVTTPFSHTSGLQIIKFDASPLKRRDLARKLKLTGCEVNTRGKKWLTAGNFPSLPAPAEPGEGSGILGVIKKLGGRKTQPQEEARPASPPWRDRIGPTRARAVHSTPPPATGQDATGLQQGRPEEKTGAEPGTALPQAPPPALPLPEQQAAPEPISVTLTRGPKIPEVSETASTTPAEPAISEKPAAPEAPEKAPVYYDPKQERQSARQEHRRKMKDLEEKLEHHKKLPGRVNRKTQSELEKQIGAENLRWQTLQKLWAIEDQKKNFPRR